MIETQEEYKARRKAISARYYQRHREAIKLAMTLDISVQEARKLIIKENENQKQAVAALFLAPMCGAVVL